MKKINNIVGKIVNSYGIGKQAESAFICYEADQISKKDFNSKFKAISFNRGILTIQTRDPMISQELQFKNKLILDKLNQKIGHFRVERIFFRN